MKNKSQTTKHVFPSYFWGILQRRFHVSNWKKTHISTNPPDTDITGVLWALSTVTLLCLWLISEIKDKLQERGSHSSRRSGYIIRIKNKLKILKDITYKKKTAVCHDSKLQEVYQHLKCLKAKVQFIFLSCLKYPFKQEKVLMIIKTLDLFGGK